MPALGAARPGGACPLPPLGHARFARPCIAWLSQKTAKGAIFTDMTTLDIERMSVKERLDLIGMLWDSLTAKDAGLTPAQEAELVRRVEAFELAHDDLAWAKPYVDEAAKEIERGEGVPLEEHEARMSAVMARLAGK
jgi:putative addiction module component (TIGR02574 family)